MNYRPPGVFVPAMVGDDTLHYQESKPIKELVQETLAQFVFSKNTDQVRYAMEASLINLFRNLERQGRIRDVVNPQLVKLVVAGDGTGVSPANVYTEALLQGCVRLGVAEDMKPVRKFTRYDIALGIV
jgi:hypothetical protein